MYINLYAIVYNITYFKTEEIYVLTLKRPVKNEWGVE